MNELKVTLENIIPLTFARDHFSQIVAEVQKDKLFVLTKGGKPAVAIIDVKYLESITGGQIQKADIKEEIKKAPEKVGLPPMVEHPPSTVPTPPPPQPQPKVDHPLDERADQPRVGKPIAPAPPPPKPAGFAAPQPQPKADHPLDERADQPRVDKPIPKPSPPPPPPKPTPPPPPPSKPQPKAWAQGPSAFGGDRPLAEAPAKGPGLVMPEEKREAFSGVPNKPLKTLPPVGQTNQVNVEFAPDEATLDKQTAEDRIPDIEKAAPDDKNPPAQYAGEEPASPQPSGALPASGEKEPEPEDMALD